MAAMGAMAARAPAAAQPQGVPPVVIAQQYYGFSIPVLESLQPGTVPCLCGRCQGIAVQFNGRLHFLRDGRPEVISRPASTE